VPQIAQSGSSASDVVTGVVETPGMGIQVHSGVGVWDPSTGQSLSQFSQPIQGLAFISAPALADVSGDGVAVRSTTLSSITTMFDRGPCGF